MRTKIKKGLLIIIILVAAIVLWIWWEHTPLPYKPSKEPVDTSIMGEEIPVKIITLNSYIESDENCEIAYLLGDKGNLYVLCYDTEKYYVALWHPEFWKDIEVVDICAERPGQYAAALDREGRVYVWEKEYIHENVSGELKINKREDWKIQQLEDKHKVDKIYAAHDQFVIVMEEGKVYRWYPEDNANPNIDDMELIEMESPVMDVAASGEELFILDENHVLWSIENGTKSFLTENVKSIVQGGKGGLAIQMLGNENDVYIYNMDLLQRGYETVTFADKYEVSKIVFADKISSLAMNNGMAVVCTDKQEFYRWGRKKVSYRHIAVPAMIVYDEPVKVDLEEVKYYIIIGSNIVYIDEQNEMFIYGWYVSDSIVGL